MISRSLVSHRATVTRRGTRTSDAGDTVPAGTYSATSIVDEPCIAEPIGGSTPAAVERETSRAAWTVLLDPGLDIRTRDRILLVGATGPTVACDVTEVRRFDVPAQIAHIRLTCQEVTG